MTIGEMGNKLDDLKIRDMVNVPELDVSRIMEDPGHMEKEKCCGGCCWFKFEDTDGWGQCIMQHDCDVMHCSYLCTTDEYVSREEMRHYMAVLLQHNRWRRFDGVPNECRMVDTKELGKAIDFSVRYMKVFSKM